MEFRPKESSFKAKNIRSEQAIERRLLKQFCKEVRKRINLGRKNAGEMLCYCVTKLEVSEMCLNTTSSEISHL